MLLKQAKTIDVFKPTLFEGLLLDKLSQFENTINSLKSEITELRLRLDQGDKIPVTDQVIETVPIPDQENTLQYLDPKSITLAPHKFQYKIMQYKNGSTGSLSGCKTWNDNLCGIILVWKDQDIIYCVNGHNRLNLALNLGVDRIPCKFIKADSAKEAREIGAIANIAENSGSVLDAAKFIKDSGKDIENLQTEYGLNIKGNIADKAVNLSYLDSGLFEKVLIGDLDLEYGIIIGKRIGDGSDQWEVYKIFSKLQNQSCKILNEIIDIHTASLEYQQDSLLDLFGNVDQKSLELRLKLTSAVKTELSQKTKLFGRTATNSNQLNLIGNKVNSEITANHAGLLEKTLTLFEQFKNLKSPVSDMVNTAIASIVKGTDFSKVKNTLIDDLIEFAQVSEGKNIG